jgi:phosphate/sulfate permease
MMKRSTRGAAKVSIVWTIVGVVAFLVALVMFFLTSQELTNQTNRADALKAELAKLTESKEAELKQKQELSAVMGFYDEASPTSTTELPALKEGLKSLHEAFPAVDENVKSLSKALPLIIQADAASRRR